MLYLPLPTNIYASTFNFIQRKYFSVFWSVLRYDGSLSTQYRTQTRISWTQFAVLYAFVYTALMTTLLLSKHVGGT